MSPSAEQRFALRTTEALKALAAFAETWRRIPGATMIYALGTTPDGQERLEALTARFARFIDLFTQRVLPEADIADGFDEGSVTERLARAERRGWISQETVWRELRQLRNKIADAYEGDTALRIARDVWAAAPELLRTSEQLEAAIARAQSGAA